MGSIDEAIAAVESGRFKNLSEVARTYKVCQSTLWRRVNGKTVSKDLRDAEKQLLTMEQESSLVSIINDLSYKGIPPTNRMIRNLAAELGGITPGKHWVERFLIRHNDSLLTSYLEGLDMSRKKSESIKVFNYYFEQVSGF